MISDKMNIFPEKFETYMEQLVPRSGRGTPQIDEAMRYSLFAGGKRLRPMLMAASYEAFSGSLWEDDKTLLAFMTALEMIHTYSLIHDDLPAMDDDDFRRGKKTNHIVFGEDMAILAGDGLLNGAFEVMAQAVQDADARQAQAIQAMTYIARTAGVRGMIGGQVIDVTGTGNDEKSLLVMYQKKTGALLAAALTAGAILGGAGRDDQRIMGIVALKAGMAYQIQDDILDVAGNEEETGKPVGSDEKRNQITYVKLKGLDQSRMDADRYLDEAIGALQRIHGQPADLTAIFKSLIGRSK